MARPTAVPRMPASASGVSTHRSEPKRSRNPAVARKTPPARPTSSPITITFSSRSSSTLKASLIASTIDSSAKDPPQVVEIRAERGRRIDECVLEEEREIRRRFRLGRRDSLAHELRGPRLDLGRRLVVEQAEPAQVAVVAADALVLLLFLDAPEIDVRTRIVGRRVRCRAIGHGLDERRALARTRVLDRRASPLG